MRRNTIILCLALIPHMAWAQIVTLQAAAQKAVLSNPEVLQRWHAYKAAQGERDAAFGGYLPRLDLSASKGRDHRDDPLLKKDYTRNATTLTLTQMLYDGFATRNEVKRFDHALIVRLFELQDASETAALEAARAYVDVQRYRKLVGLAEENYVRHRSVFEQIQKKVQAGVGRRVDLEQAAGRLALAEANLLTETSNLHDVSARYMRVVGEQPAREMESLANLTRGTPKDMAEALTAAQRGNPALLASIENVRSAYSAARVRDAAYQPRLDLRLKRDHGHNLNGYTGQHESSTAEVVLSWNLFSGFSDIARSRQYAEQHNVARDIRDKTCRDIRQNLAIAYNDTRKLTEQLGYLDQHQISIEKARDAYRKQFDIGQRTLLDLLDSENELFQARRAYGNAEHDLAIAYVRTHAGLGKLLTTLGVSKAGDPPPAEPEMWAAGEEAPENCPPDNPHLYVANKEALNARAQEMLKELAPPPAATEAPASPTPEVTAERAVAEALKAWSLAWVGRNTQGYLDAYAASFAPADGSTRAAWAVKRKNALARANDITLDVRDIKLAVKDARHASTVFKQAYHSGQFKDVVLKTLEWEQVDGRWLIVRETAEPLK
ncbi:MAG: TolC family outer membrane protein [Rhodocyclales bacterium]|nr:TolC family outer membrane protein [Rhodocyclales bacterium]